MVAILGLFITSPGSIGSEAAVYEFEFWPGKGAEKDPRFVATKDHPCGSVVLARVSSLPLFRQGAALIPELVMELSSSGEVIRRWPMPVDGRPIGLSGVDLLVKEAFEFWVTPQGAIAPYKDNLSLPKPEPIACKPSRASGDSAYVQCQRFRDLVSGKGRILSFEGVCT